MSGAESGLNERWTYSFRAVPGAVPRAQLRSTLTYTLMPRLRVGVEVNPRSEKEKVNPLLNWLAVTEGRKRPAITRLVAKDLSQATGLPVAP